MQFVKCDIEQLKRPTNRLISWQQHRFSRPRRPWQDTNLQTGNKVVSENTGKVTQKYLQLCCPMCVTHIAAVTSRLSSVRGPSRRISVKRLNKRTITLFLKQCFNTGESRVFHIGRLSSARDPSRRISVKRIKKGITRITLFLKQCFNIGESRVFDIVFYVCVSMGP